MRFTTLSLSNWLWYSGDNKSDTHLIAHNPYNRVDRFKSQNRKSESFHYQQKCEKVKSFPYLHEMFVCLFCLPFRAHIRSNIFSSNTSDVSELFPGLKLVLNRSFWNINYRLSKILSKAWKAGWTTNPKIWKLKYLA